VFHRIGRCEKGIAAMNGTARHGKMTGDPHRPERPVLKLAGMRSVEIIGSCGFRFRGRLLLYAPELTVIGAIAQGEFPRFRNPFPILV
jgi:hypothetical protein